MVLPLLPDDVVEGVLQDRIAAAQTLARGVL